MSKTITPETPRVPEHETREWAIRVQEDAIRARGGGHTDTSFTPPNPHDVELTPEEEARIIGEARRKSPVTKSGT